MLSDLMRAYAYAQYADDDYIPAFIECYNVIAQEILTFMAEFGLPIYTMDNKSDALLDWIAEGVYGLKRPTLPMGITITTGPYNTNAYNTIAFNAEKTQGAKDYYTTTDDIFKRLMTWNLYKGDGADFNISWLKRRIMRFLNGANGVDVEIDNTYPVSIAYTGDSELTITITQSDTTTAGLLRAAILAGAAQVPFMYSYIINVVEG